MGLEDLPTSDHAKDGMAHNVYYNPAAFLSEDNDSQGPIGAAARQQQSGNLSGAETLRVLRCEQEREPMTSIPKFNSQWCDIRFI